MSSTDNNKIKFSMEDFEKGLMLLGLVSPKSIEELEEKQELDLFEKSNSKDKSKTYFKRTVLAAEIVTQLREERTFGRIKFQKLVYLCEHVSEMNLEERYVKQAAGPFDNKFMHSINKEFKKQKWFDAVDIYEKGYKLQKYLPLENAADYKQYFIKYFSRHDSQIQFIINLFRHKKTDDTELAATILACVLELTTTSNNLTWNQLFQLFYDWHDKKKRFTQEQIISSLKWLQGNGLLLHIIVA